MYNFALADVPTIQIHRAQTASIRNNFISERDSITSLLFKTSCPVVTNITHSDDAAVHTANDLWVFEKMIYAMRKSQRASFQLAPDKALYSS
jgi:hypothetical protein